MEYSIKLTNSSLWGAFTVVLCAFFCVVGLVRFPVTDHTMIEAKTAETNGESSTTIRAKDVEAAVSLLYRNQQQRDLVGSLELKIYENFPVPLTEANEFATWIVHSADKHGVVEVLLTSIVATESSFRKDAISHKGAIGPAQIMPRFWEEFCSPLDLSAPGDNIECGARILSHLLEQCWDESCAIQSYNMGFPRVKAGKKFPSVERYQRTVEQFKEMFAFNF